MFNSPGIWIIYLALLGIGIIYAILILIGSELQGLHLHLPGLHLPDFNVHLDGHDIGLGHTADISHAEVSPGVEHPTIKVPSLSPITVASFVTAFGAFGLVALGLFNTDVRASLAWAAIGGVIIAVIAHFAFGYFLIAPQGSSEVRLKDIVGTPADVITPIPAGSVGEIAFVAQGGRLTYTAQSASGEPIPRGTTVVIEKVIGGVALVRPQASENKS